MATKNSKDKNAARIVALGLILGLGLTVTGCGPESGSAGVDDETLCIEVTNPGDTKSFTVTATRFIETGTEIDENSDFIVLQHGLANTRNVFDAEFNLGTPKAGSFARDLAKKGYVVVTYDAPGYGSSPYTVPGKNDWDLTAVNYSDFLHQVVQKLRTGKYKRTAANCFHSKELDDADVSFKKGKLLVGGFSRGGMVAQAYGGTYGVEDKLAGLIQLSPQADLATSSDLLAHLVTYVVPYITGTNLLNPDADQVDFFVPDYTTGSKHTGYSEVCKNLIFHEEGAVKGIAEEFCRNYRLQKDPGGVFISTPLVVQYMAARLAWPTDIPVLLIHGEKDKFFPAPTDTSLTNYSTLMLAKWTTDCPTCDVDAYVVPNAGHVIVAGQKAQPEMMDKIDEWLADHDL